MTTTVFLIILYSLIIIAALFGFSITARINREKKSEKPMTCPLGADCETVVNSEFSSFLGIGLEIYGALYYVLIIIAYSTMLAFLPQTPSDIVAFLLTGFTIGAFLFSVYLTIVQAFYLRSWCTWCLFSALVSTIIFIISLIALFVADVNFIPILAFLYKPILILHLLGFALGVGGATISDILFLKFLKDFKISVDEEKILRIMSQIVWVGLLLAIISGIGLYLPNMEALNESSKFLTKTVVVLVIIVNGALLNLIVAPRLMRITSDAGMHVKKTHFKRKLAFALGAISFVSWYTAFVLGTLESVPVTFLELLSAYGLLLVVAVSFSQVAERFYCKHKRANM